MSEFISSGLNGEVFTISGRDKILFPQADLVKTTYVVERDDMMLTFYLQKIVEQLVPESSIHIISTYHDPKAQIQSDFIKNRYTIVERDYPVRVLSKKVEVHPDHAQFSAHSTRGHFLPEFGAAWKDLDCKHEACHDHNSLHQTKEWMRKFRSAQRKYHQIGVEVPKTDETDWCLDASGQIVFFEFDHLNHKRLFDYLSSLRNPTQSQRRAYQLLLRYEKLFYEHYKDWNLDEPTRPEELIFNGKSWVKTQLRKLIPFS